MLRPGGVFLYDTVNRTARSKFLVKLSQEWSLTRFLPPNVHAWEMFIAPRELQDVLARYDLHSRGPTGASGTLGALGTLVELRRFKAGEISAAEFGRRAALRPSADLSCNDMGYAVK